MKKILTLASLLGVLTQPAPVDAADMLKLRQAEKISLTLTGQPLSDELRKSFLADQLSLDALADTLSKDPKFIENFALYYSRTLGFQLPFNAYELKDAKQHESFASILSLHYPETYNSEFASSYTAEKMKSHAASMRGPLQVRFKDCPAGPQLIFDVGEKDGTKPDDIKKSQPVINAATKGIGPDGQPILPGTEIYWKEILPLYRGGNLPCDSNELVDIKPWWDPIQVTTDAKYKGLTTYKTPPVVIAHCGGITLPLCNTKNLNDKDSLTDTFNRDLMLEPGFIIGHTVAEDKPFSEILTTSDTIMTGTYGAWMHYNGSLLWANYPAGTIDDIKHPIFESPNAADRTHYRIKRNALHAGVLTTPAYQLLTNGRRAKANKAYETFLCSKFGVPADAKPDPTDSNPDLTKRAFCKFCHVGLEPMAAFFNAWPLTGNLNYIYDAAEPDDTGRFAGSTGRGAAAFGKIMTGTEAFASCSVKRAFEFVNGRKMSQSESEVQLPRYMTLLRSSQMSLRAVIKAMLADPQFLNPTKE